MKCLIETGIRGKLLAVAFTAAVMAAILVMLLLRSHPERVVLKAYEEFSGMLRVRQQNTDWYRRRKGWLIRKGAPFHYGAWVNPMRLLALQLVLGAAGLLAFGTASMGAGVLAGGVLFLLPQGILVYLNGRDNVEMLGELKLIYHALELQLKAGIYVTDALAECYGCVRNRRLRQALLDLAGDIVMKADIYEALNQFQQKFDNRYVDTLVITLLQALESGQALELLSDISEQLKDMENTVLERRKGRLDRSLTMYQLGILAAVLGVALYACISHMLSAANFF